MTEGTLESSSTRWRMLVIISFGYVAMTLNWFNIAAAFGPINTELGASFPALALLISLFLLGNGIAHIPGGMVATRWGLKRTVVLGVALQAVAGALSGLAPNYGVLAMLRFVAGVGAAIFLAVGVAAITVWFAQRELALALGVGTGVGFCVGVAAGLYGSSLLQDLIGWRMALVAGGVFGIVIAIVTAVGFRTPPGATALHGVPLSRSAMREALAHRQIWIYGVAMLGGYGAYFTATQLLGEYAVSERGFTAGAGALLAALVGLAGIPGSVMGGWIADRGGKVKTPVAMPILLMAALLILVPFMPAALLWPVGIGIGFFLLYSFTAWSAVPERVARTSHENIGTAFGLMLTIAAVGGFLVPLGFGYLVPVGGYTVGWIFLGVVSAAFALVGYLGRESTETTPGSATTLPAKSATDSDPNPVST